MGETDIAAPPGSADVVVIGGGIVGCSTAWFLVRRGLRVVLCEKGRIAGEQSGRNWGFVRQQYRDEAELPIMMESLRIWRGLETETGEDVGFAQGGCLYLARTKKELDRQAEWLPVAERHQLDTRVVTGGDLAKLLGGADGRWAGALYTASDGRAEPAKATLVIARAAQRSGATVLTNCAVRGLETEAGRVSAVVTERGTIRAPKVVCAAGVWSRLFSANLGITVPQLKVHGTVARTAPAPEITGGNVWSPEVAIRRRDDGGYTVANSAATTHPIVPDSFRFFRLFLGSYHANYASLRLRLDGRFLDELATPRRWALDAPTPFEKTRVFDPAPAPGILREIRRNLGRWFPQLAEVPFVETWGGMIEAAPDALPMIGEVEALPGYYMATGFSGHGFGIGPGMGKVIADLVSGAPPAFDLDPFRLARFFDGTPL